MTSEEIVRVQQVVRELAESWERALALLDTCSKLTDIELAQKEQLRSCLIELRAEIRKLPNPRKRANHDCFAVPLAVPFLNYETNGKRKAITKL